MSLAFSKEDLEQIYESVVYQCGSLEYLSKFQALPFDEPVPPAIKKYDHLLTERMRGLQQLARKIESMLIALSEETQNK